MMGTFSINMKQFHAKFKVTSDNVRIHENVVINKGKFFTMDAQRYIEELNLFGIFYTFTS